MKLAELFRTGATAVNYRQCIGVVGLDIAGAKCAPAVAHEVCAVGACRKGFYLAFGTEAKSRVEYLKFVELLNKYDIRPVRWNDKEKLSLHEIGNRLDDLDA